MAPTRADTQSESDEVPSLLEPGSADLTTAVALNLLNTRIPTAELLADLADEVDQGTLSLVSKLRAAVFLREDDGWTGPQDHQTSGLGEPRCCSAASLEWHHGVAVEVYGLSLPESLAEQQTDDADFGPLRTSKAECLRVAMDGGHLVGSYGTVILREGEKARLTSGWTRARLTTNAATGHPDSDLCADVFSGLRVAVSAHAPGGETGEWELGVFASSGGLRNETGVLVGPPGPAQDGRAEYHMRSKNGVRLGVGSKERCWMARTRGRWEASETQVLLCASVVELD